MYLRRILNRKWVQKTKMASQVGRVIHDQNLNVQSNGASVVGKADTVKNTRERGPWWKESAR
ncbi:hypothetical protein Prudu_019097 [Prunus dulcis]|uniref:Uncharacterized protein n=1 Tax=Prunus dulcis TaxID=3755 RepID=A0A4Y1RTY9_PRUDU|nr:hypothetical protein Prudu_019097 [Prunus dulcis]